MKVVPIKSPEEWNAIRAQHVGGSEIAALFGMSPYMTKFQLWHIKAGSIAPEDLSDDVRIQAGQYIEPAIAAWASDKWGMPLRKFEGYAVHPTIKGMGCTPDYISADGKKLVQIKNVDSFEFRNKWVAEGEEIIDAPLHILLQCQHELAVTGAEESWLVPCVGGNRILRGVYAPRPATISKLETEVASFWQSVAIKKEPKPDFHLDADTIAALNVDAEKGKEIDLTANNRAHEVCAAWLRGKMMVDEGEKVLAESKSELLPLLSDASKAKIGDFSISAPNVRASKGKAITPEMIGMITGARSAHRRFSVTFNQGETA